MTYSYDRQGNMLSDGRNRYAYDDFGRLVSTVILLYYTLMHVFFRRKKEKASFLIDKERVSKELQEKIRKEENKLRKSVEFENGMKKNNPWNTIMRFNKYYQKKYGICII